LSSLKNSNAEVNSSNYTYSNGKLTLLSAYLAAMTAGDKTFTVTMSDGTTATFTVKVTA